MLRYEDETAIKSVPRLCLPIVDDLVYVESLIDNHPMEEPIKEYVHKTAT
jgi:hypothetical protein